MTSFIFRNRTEIKLLKRLSRDLSDPLMFRAVLRPALLVAFLLLALAPSFSAADMQALPGIKTTYQARGGSRPSSPRSDAPRMNHLLI